ncbi:hypothetical protein EMCRGX_G017300 [Ephydatia muelleri]
MNLQSEVEDSDLYLIAINPSTIEDQASIIPDRVDLKEPILSTAGIPVQDVLRFFTGDHPAAQFERGTQTSAKNLVPEAGTAVGKEDHNYKMNSRYPTGDSESAITNPFTP